jgi:hypothetical protein
MRLPWADLGKTVMLCIGVIGLALAGCASQVAQPTEQEKKYTADTSFCRAVTMEMPEKPEAFDQCMASRGWP